MKLSLNWIKDYVAVNLSAQDLADRLTMAGQEVERIHEQKNDVVFELEITPNRPDCLNIVGLAREISAILNKPLKQPTFSKKIISKTKPKVTIEDKNGCKRYIATVIENVSIRESSKFIKDRIEALGLRAINNVVDITNFSLMELGQPLHAFDYDKLAGKSIHVRRAKDGEKIVTLDGVERKLDSSILVIADEKKAIAIAGIMGGKDTEVDANTKNILLESAWFDPVVVRRAARKLGLSSDSSYRFERGVNLDNVEKACLRANFLIQENAGGKVSAYQDVNLFVKKSATKKINLTLLEINNYLGSTFSLKECKNILEKLGCSVNVGKNKQLNISVPSFRADLKITVDIIEEIGRVIGYDRLPTSLPQITISSLINNREISHQTKIRDLLLAQGLDEIITYAMCDQKSLGCTNISKENITKIKNPLSLEQEMMRPSILPNMLAVVARNFNVGEKNLRLFEIGKNYLSGREFPCLGIIMTGKEFLDWRQAQKRELDFYDLKGSIQNIFAAFNIEDINFYPQNISYLDDRVSTQMVIANDVVGHLGRVSDEILANWDIKTKNVYFSLLDLEKFYSLISNEIVKFKSLSSFPAVNRDVSLAIKNDTTYQQLEHQIYRMGEGLLSSVKFNEQYLGEKIQEGHRGVVFTLTYQLPDRTLKEEEVTNLHEKIVQSLIDQFGAFRR